MNQLELVGKVSNVSERFNLKTIKYRDSENYKAYIEEACRSLNICPNIKFLDMTVIEDETKMEEWPTVNIDESRVNQVTLRFKINFEKEEEIVTKTFYVPKMLGDKFVINNTKYYPIYQIIDNGIFITPKVFSLKTSLMPIRFNYKKDSVKDDFGNIVEGFSFNLGLFKNKLNYLYYFFAKMGLFETLEYFGMDSEEELFLTAEKVGDEYIKSYYVFSLPNDTYLLARKKSFSKNLFKRSFLIDLVDVLTSNKKNSFDEDFFTKKHWMKVLGKFFTVSNQEYKAEKILISLERIIGGDSTRGHLDELEDSDKVDTYSVLRWMLRNFDTLRYHDNRSLRYKRIQCWEYLIQPLLEFFSFAIYRLNNTRNLTMKTLTGIFNIGPNFLLKRLLNNELIRYSDAVNDTSLFNTSLCVTFKGKGSVTGGSGSVADKYREAHRSYIGNLSLVASSAGDPGMSTTISPFCRIENGRFKDFEHDKE